MQHDLVASFVIPAHNEEGNLPKTVAEIQEAMRSNGIPYEIVCVDDNSSDGTAQVIAELQRNDPNIKAVHRDPPPGFGRAIRAGLEAVTGDLVIIYMADQSDDPEDALVYIRKIEEGFDCVYGSRFRRGSTVENYPWVKLIWNRIVNRCVQFMFRCKFNDLTNAFKAYRIHVVRSCGPYVSCHFNITLEMSLSALNRGYAITEVPIGWYGRTWGSSKLKLTEMGRRYLATLLKAYSEKMLVSDDLLADRLANQMRESREQTRLEHRLQALESRVQALEGKPEPQDAAAGGPLPRAEASGQR